MDTKSFHLSLASHLPSAKTLYCEIGSIISNLRKFNQPVQDIQFNDITRKLEFTLKANEDTKDQPSNFVIAFVGMQNQNTRFEIDLNQSTRLIDQLLVIERIKKHIGSVLTGGKSSIIQAFKLSGRTLTIEIGAPKRMHLAEENSEDILLLIDGSNLLARSYFATSFKGDLMTNQEGLYTNGVYIFAKKLMKLIQKFRATHVIVCWDVGRDETFRREIYPEYKGLRGETESELKQQFTTTEQMLKLMNIPQLRLTGYEADDLIGTFVSSWKNQMTGKAVIYSNDKDLHQLLDEDGDIHQIISKSREEYLFSSKSFEKEYGVKPDQWVDVKAILGETGASSDNIPGIKGVGPKAAFPLIQAYGSLQGIYENINQLPDEYKRYIKKFVDGKENALLSQKLARIVTDVPSLKDSDFTQYKLSIDQKGIRQVSQWLNFKQIA